MKDAYVSEMIEEFLYSLKVVSNREDSTITDYGICLREFNQYLFANEGKISDMKDLTSLDLVVKWFNVRRYGEDGKKPLSVSSLNKRLTALNTFYKFLIGRLFDIKQVTLGIPKFQKENDANNKKKFLQISEVENILDTVEEDDKKLTAYENKRNEMMIKLFVGCGLRINELSLLTFSHIDANDKKIYITNDIAKRGKSRVVDIPSDVVKLYKEYLVMRKEHKNKSEFLFISRKNNKMHVDSIRNVVTKVSTKANGEKINPHGLRHTYGTQQIAAGQDPVYVSQQMGHANLSITTGLYVHQTQQTFNRADNNPMFNRKKKGA